jgi:hypothetical protein
MNDRNAHTIVAITRWSARVLGTAFFLLWGAFFLEHLEWLSDPSDLPPRHVIAGMLLHFLMLAGFVVAWKWETAGAVMIIAGAFLFFPRAGENYLLFAGVTSIPAVLLLVVRFMAGKKELKLTSQTVDMP